jgi:hypothetical protein
MMVVDRFSKYGHFIALGHPYSAASVAKAFFNGIIRLHGIPMSIVSDWDPIFTSNMWTELFRLTGTKLCTSSAFRPQTDGQSEVTNKIIIVYLRCLAGDRPHCWLRWLPWAEFCYNTSYLRLSMAVHRPTCCHTNQVWPESRRQSITSCATATPWPTSSNVFSKRRP